MKFRDYYLSPEVQRGIETLGFRRPTDIQYKSIPPILKGEDVLAVAQTGTGKTAAFAIPLLNKLHNARKFKVDGVKCLILAPTHELVLQLTDVFKTLGKFTKVRITPIIGGVDQQPQIEKLNRGTDIVIATPGRMFDLISQGFLKVKPVEILVLDEADHMLDLGFLQDIYDLSKKLPHKRQTLFFSATISKTIKKLAYSLIRQGAIRIQISPKDPVARNINHFVAFIEMDDKRFFLEHLIKENPDTKMLIFVRTKVRAERVLKAMERVNIESQTLHSDKTQIDRNTILNRFRSGENHILIATDITARGIDIPDVDLVINYDLPEKDENYVHRVGRTGRGKNKGIAYSFCSKGEKEILEKIESYLGKSIEVLDISKKAYKEVLQSTRQEMNDLDALLQEIEAEEKTRKKKKKK